jgi:Domain of unknown function (DUF4281)
VRVQLNADRRMALAAWLAFDLLVGSFIVGEARRGGIKAAWRIPALSLTFQFGPAGWLWFRTQVLAARGSGASEVRFLTHCAARLGRSAD